MTDPANRHPCRFSDGRCRRDDVCHDAWNCAGGYPDYKSAFGEIIALARRLKPLGETSEVADQYGREQLLEALGMEEEADA